MYSEAFNDCIPTAVIKMNVYGNHMGGVDADTIGNQLKFPDLYIR